MPGGNPHEALAQKRMLHCKGFGQRQEFGIARKLSLADSTPAAYQPCFYSSVNAPTTCLSFWFPAIRRSARGLSRRFPMPGGIGPKRVSPAAAHAPRNLTHSLQRLVTEPPARLQAHCGLYFYLPRYGVSFFLRGRKKTT